jgi:hypothetical protein
MLSIKSAISLKPSAIYTLGLLGEGLMVLGALLQLYYGQAKGLNIAGQWAWYRGIVLIGHILLLSAAVLYLLRKK